MVSVASDHLSVRRGYAALLADLGIILSVVHSWGFGLSKTIS